MRTISVFSSILGSGSGPFKMEEFGCITGVDVPEAFPFLEPLH
jgi:hypothetical protein